jgi:hypothetical protein
MDVLKTAVDGVISMEEKKMKRRIIISVLCGLLLGAMAMSCYSHDGESREVVIPDNVVLSNAAYPVVEANWRALEIPFDDPDSLGTVEFVTNAPQGGGDAIKLNMRASVTSTKKLPRNFRLEFKFLLDSDGRNGWFGVRPTDEKGPCYQEEKNEYHSACLGYAPCFFYKGGAGWATSDYGYGFDAGSFGSWELAEKPVGNKQDFTLNVWHTVVIQSILGSHKMTIDGDEDGAGGEDFKFASAQNMKDQYLSFVTGTWGGAMTMYIKDVKF